MSKSRLPPLTNYAEDSEVLDYSTIESASVSKPKRKKHEEQLGSEPKRSSRELRRQASLANSNASATDESQLEATSSSVKQPRKAKASASTEQLVSDVQRPKTNAAKKKRKANSRVIDNPVFVGDRGLVSELAELDEDIVDSTANAEQDSSHAQTIAEVVAMRSEPTQKVYLEKSDGFKPANKDKLNVKRVQAADAVANANAMDHSRALNTVDFALSTHRVFKTIALFLQGLFSGFVLWQIVSSESLIAIGSYMFSSYYLPLSIPFQSVYFFFSAVSCVAVLDRYDLANLTRRLLKQSISFQAGTVCVLFYFIGLVISLGTAYFDEGIGLNQSAVLAGNTMTSSCTWLCQWQILNIFRGVLAILGWFVVSLSPATDRLTKSLLRMNDDILQPTNNQNNGMTSVKRPTSSPVDSTQWTTA